jgi:hypothetical protein
MLSGCLEDARDTMSKAAEEVNEKAVAGLSGTLVPSNALNAILINFATEALRV